MSEDAVKEGSEANPSVEPQMASFSLMTGKQGYTHTLTFTVDTNGKQVHVQTLFGVC